MSMFTNGKVEELKRQFSEAEGKEAKCLLLGFDELKEFYETNLAKLAGDDLLVVQHTQFAGLTLVAVFKQSYIGVT